MKEIILDGNLMRENPHVYLKDKLDFPDYYGMNLDALYDCLCDIFDSIKIIIINSDLLDKNLILTFEDAACNNENISILLR